MERIYKTPTDLKVNNYIVTFRTEKMLECVKEYGQQMAIEWLNGNRFDADELMQYFSMISQNPTMARHALGNMLDCVRDCIEVKVSMDKFMYLDNYWMQGHIVRYAVEFDEDDDILFDLDYSDFDEETLHLDNTDKDILYDYVAENKVEIYDKVQDLIRYYRDYIIKLYEIAQ